MDCLHWQPNVGGKTTWRSHTGKNPTFSSNAYLLLSGNGIRDDWEHLPLFASQQAVTQAQQDFMHAQRIAQNPENVAASLREFGTGSMPDLWSSLKQIEVETILVNGTLDQKFVAISREMLLQLPHARNLILPEVGHNVHFEKPEAYTHLLNEI